MTQINANKTKRIIDTALFFVFCSLVGTGVGMAFGLGENEMHLPLAVVFIVLILCHLLLNRKWISTVLANNSKPRVLSAIIIGIALLLLFVFFPIEKHKHQQGKHHGQETPLEPPSK